MLVKGHFGVVSSALKETISKLVSFCALYHYRFYITDCTFVKDDKYLVSFDFSDVAFSHLEESDILEFVYYWTDFATSIMRMYDVKVWFDCLVKDEKDIKDKIDQD